LNLKQLAAFREVMLSGSVSQAARNLNLTQPAVSASLRTLEDELQLKLFERRQGRLIAVPEAHYLLAEASETLDRLAATKQNLRSLSSKKSGVLQIVAMPGPSVFLLPKLISQFVADNNDVKVTLTTRSSQQVQQMVATQNFDLGIADLGADKISDFNLVEADILNSTGVCAVPARDPLAQKTIISASDLDGMPMAVLQHTHSSHILTKATFDAAGATFNPRFEAQYFLPLFTFVEAGQAYAIVDKLSAESYRLYTRGEPEIVFRPYVPEVVLRFALLTPAHRPSSMLASSFAELWKETVARIESDELLGS